MSAQSRVGLPGRAYPLPKCPPAVLTSLGRLHQARKPVRSNQDSVPSPTALDHVTSGGAAAILSVASGSRALEKCSSPWLPARPFSLRAAGAVEEHSPQIQPSRSSLQCRRRGCIRPELVRCLPPPPLTGALREPPSEMSSEESYRAILRYLTNEREPYAPGTEGNVKRKIRKAAACYVVRGGTLYYQRRQRHRKTFAELEVVLQPERRRGLIEAAHLGPGGTHHTRHQTWHDLSKTYWWRGRTSPVAKGWAAACCPGKARRRRRACLRTSELEGPRRPSPA